MFVAIILIFEFTRFGETILPSNSAWGRVGTFRDYAPGVTKVTPIAPSLLSYMANIEAHF